MIFVGFVLFAIGAADVIRAFVAQRWLGYLAVAAVVVLFGGFSGAVLEAIVAIVIAALWIWLVPTDGPARAGFWPVLALAALCAVGVMSVPPRVDTGAIGAVWELQTPAGELSFDAAVLVFGAVVFLLESANVIVRIALNAEGGARHAARDAASPLEAMIDEADADTDPREAQPLDRTPALRGGRLIGPLERLLVFALTLLSAYTLVAAFVAAKGIVRFPEISRDSSRGNAAEYFLIGSMVSWVTALAAAALVWWALSTI